MLNHYFLVVVKRDKQVWMLRERERERERGREGENSTRATIQRNRENGEESDQESRK